MLEQLERLVSRIGQTEALDKPAAKVADAVNAATAATPVKNALNGSWLGHPVHPLLVAFPIGAWGSAMAMDLLAPVKGADAVDLLLGLGLASAVPTAATGLANWSDLFGADKRIGLVHATSNVVATTLFGLALVERRRGRRGMGRMLAFAGLGATTVGGWLGGHLTYRRGAGVDHTAFQEAAEDWTTVARLSELADGKGHAAEVNGVTILLARDGGTVRALADVCTHAGGPLHEGAIADGCVTCPWHGSCFRLEDGTVVRSPATAPQPVYETRISGDDVQVRKAAS